MHDLISRLAIPGLLAFLLNFGFGKGLAFVAPIGLGLFLAADVYGTLEAAFAASGFLATFASFGITQSAMQLTVMRQGRAVLDLLAGTTAVLGVLAFTVALGLLMAGWRADTSLMLALLALVICQQASAAYTRAKGWRNLTVWADHLTMTLVLVAALGAALIAKPVATNSLTMILMAMAGIACAFATAVFLQHRAPLWRERWGQAARLGLPMLAASVCYGWTIASGRLYLDWFLSKGDVYAYAFTFRVASLLVLLHAVIVTAFAAKLYKMPTRRFDTIAASMIGALTIGSLIFVWAAPQNLMAAWQSPANAAQLAARPAIALVVAQVYFWVAAAFVEMRLARARRAGAMVPRCLAIMTLFALVLGLAAQLGQLSFAVVLCVLVGQQALICLAMHEVLARRKVPLRKTAMVTLAGGVLVSAVAYWTAGL